MNIQTTACPLLLSGAVKNRFGISDKELLNESQRDSRGSAELSLVTDREELENQEALGPKWVEEKERIVSERNTIGAVGHSMKPAGERLES